MTHVAKDKDKREDSHTTGKHADPRTAKDRGQVGRHRPKDGTEKDKK